jgi:hypothetical protein
MQKVYTFPSLRGLGAAICYGGTNGPIIPWWKRKIIAEKYTKLFVAPIGVRVVLGQTH